MITIKCLETSLEAQITDSRYSIKENDIYTDGRFNSTIIYCESSELAELKTLLLGTQHKEVTVSFSDLNLTITYIDFKYVVSADCVFLFGGQSIWN